MDSILIYFILFSAIFFNTIHSQLGIIDGEVVNQRSQFPYQISLRQGSHHICGGSIIDDKHILTAAQCVTDKQTGKILPTEDLEVVAGDLNILASSSSSTVNNSVQYIFTHDSYEYNSNNVKGDIAVIRINAPYYSWNVNISAINLALEVVYNDNCTVSGWGEFSRTSDDFSGDLRYANLSIVPHHVCEAQMMNNLNQMICASAPGISTCEGDEGGPLVCSTLLTGIYSWGYGCGSSIYPGIYTDVSKYRDWIYDTMERSTSRRLLIPIYLLIASIVVHIY